jgi:hypothetical protein
MSYKLNKTNGALLVDLIDGQIDTETTDLTLVGRNYSGFGEFLNENYIKLLENFANSSAPGNPIEGQIWYDTATNRLKVFNGETFNIAGGPIVQPTQPNMVAGDQWINNSTKQIYFYDGTNPYLIGPAYTAQQGTSGFIVSSILDTQSRSRTVVNLYVGGTLVAVISNIEFTPALGQEISGLTGSIKKGFNLLDTTGFKFDGAATYANALIADNGEFKNVSQFLPADGDGTTVGALTIANSNGLTIGLAQNLIQRVIGNSVVVENGLLDNDYKIRVTSSAEDSRLIDALVIDASAKRVGLWNSTPEYTLDVTGDLRITGNLLVEGDTTSVDVTTIKVEDKNIELAAPSDSALLDNVAVDDAGVVVRGSEGDKRFTWKNATQSWTSTENMDLEQGKWYKVNGQDVLGETAIGASVTQALGLIQIGDLENLTVDDIFINDSTIQTTVEPLRLTSNGTIVINTQKITGVVDPTNPQDVATKNYVDTIVASEPVVFSLDITGLNNTQIASIINDLYPATAKTVGTYARIHTTELTNTVVTGIQITVRDSTEPDLGEVLELTKIDVDSAGTQNEPVVRDVEFRNPASGPVNVTVQRGLKQFQVKNTGGSNFWEWDQDLTSSV